MTVAGSDGSLRWRMLLAALLGAAALILFLVERLSTPDLGLASRPASGVAEDQAAFQQVIDTLLVRHRVPRGSLRTWRVLSSTKKPVRVEQRVSVPREFPSLIFNYELNRRLEALGAHVVATERTKEQTVTMHIIHRGMTVRSVAFVTTSGS